MLQTPKCPVGDVQDSHQTTPDQSVQRHKHCSLHHAATCAQLHQAATAAGVRSQGV